MPEPEIIEGFGCRSQIGRICSESGFDTVLILTDKLLCDLGYLEAVEKSLEDKGIRYKVFDGITTEPRLEYIEAGRSIALETEAKCIITIGGGSVMDTGKMVASGCRLAHLPVDMLLQKFLVVPEKSLPIIAVPSTAGTGAEVTVGAVITKRRGGKFASVIVGLNVHTVLLDSELTAKAPWNITASCGIDALSHGLEGSIADVRCSQADLEKSRQCHQQTVGRVCPRFRTLNRGEISYPARHGNRYVPDACPALTDGLLCTSVVGTCTFLQFQRCGCLVQCFGIGDCTV